MTIPSSIFTLTLLQFIHLSFNSLSGSIPNTIGQLKELQYLDMRHNALTGTIPSSFSMLQSLSIIRLDTNHLTMGSATTVPTSTFSLVTQQGSLSLENNCLAYTSLTNPSQSTTATNCRPLQNFIILLFHHFKHVLICLYCLSRTPYSITGRHTNFAPIKTVHLQLWPLK